MRIDYTSNKKVRAKLDFSEIKEGIKMNNSKVVPSVPTVLDLRNSYQLNMKGFISKFNNIDQMTDPELMNFTQLMYLDALEAANIKSDNKLDDTDYKKLIDIFTNARFLVCLKSIINSNPLSYHHSVYLNNLCYQYLIVRDPSTKDWVVNEIYLQMAQINNIVLITQLISAGVDKNLSTTLALAANASFEDAVRIKRVNKVLVYSPLDHIQEYTLQMLVDIYAFIFGKSVSKLFCCHMFHIFDKSKLSEKQIETLSLCDMAILKIVNSLSEDGIKTVLSYYNVSTIGNPNYVRFSMNCLSQDFSRINKVLHELNSLGIIVP